MVYDLDFRPGQLSIVLTRFLKSAWKVFWREQFDQVEKVEVPVEIGPWVELIDSVRGAGALVLRECAGGKLGTKKKPLPKGIERSKMHSKASEVDDFNHSYPLYGKSRIRTRKRFPGRHARSYS